MKPSKNGRRGFRAWPFPARSFFITERLWPNEGFCSPISALRVLPFSNFRHGSRLPRVPRLVPFRLPSRPTHRKRSRPGNGKFRTRFHKTARRNGKTSSPCSFQNASPTPWYRSRAWIPGKNAPPSRAKSASRCAGFFREEFP